MDCPCCGGEMQDGFIQSKTLLTWHESEKIAYQAGDLFGGVALSEKWKPVKGFITRGKICRKCRKVIIDYPG